jgi:hypothetical protein
MKKIVFILGLAHCFIIFSADGGYASESDSPAVQPRSSVQQRSALQARSLPSIEDDSESEDESRKPSSTVVYPVCPIDLALSTIPVSPQQHLDVQALLLRSIREQARQENARRQARSVSPELALAGRGVDFGIAAALFDVDRVPSRNSQGARDDIVEQREEARVDEALARIEHSAVMRPARSAVGAAAWNPFHVGDAPDTDEDK